MNPYALIAILVSVGEKTNNAMIIQHLIGVAIVVVACALFVGAILALDRIFTSKK